MRSYAGLFACACSAPLCIACSPCVSHTAGDGCCPVVPRLCILDERTCLVCNGVLCVSWGVLGRRVVWSCLRRREAWVRDWVVTSHLTPHWVLTHSLRIIRVGQLPGLRRLQESLCIVGTLCRHSLPRCLPCSPALADPKGRARIS